MILYKLLVQEKLILIVFLLKIFFIGLFPLKYFSISIRKYLPMLIVDNLQKAGLNHITFLLLCLVFFFISTAAIIVIPITSAMQPFIRLTIHSPTITTTIVIVGNVVIVIVFSVTSFKIIFQNF